MAAVVVWGRENKKSLSFCRRHWNKEKTRNSKSCQCNYHFKMSNGLSKWLKHAGLNVAATDFTSSFGYGNLRMDQK